MVRNVKLELFFQDAPQALPLYLQFATKVLALYPKTIIKIQKTQIAFSSKRSFALVWLPPHKVKGRPKTYIIVSLILPYRLEFARVVEAVEPYPNRWIHHLIVANPDDLDEMLLQWIKQAHDFAVR